VPHALDQFVLKIKKKLSYTTGTALILEMARDYGLRPRLRLLLFFSSALFFLAIILKKILGSMPEKRFSTPKMYSVSLKLQKLLKKQFNFQNGLGNIEVRA